MIPGDIKFSGSADLFSDRSDDLRLKKSFFQSLAVHLFVFVIIWGFSLGLNRFDEPEVQSLEIDLADLQLSDTKATSAVKSKVVEPQAAPVETLPVVKEETNVLKESVAKKPEKKVVKKKAPKVEKPKESAAEKRRKAMASILAGMGKTEDTAKPTANAGVSSDSLAGSVTELLFKKQIKTKIESKLFVTNFDWFERYKNRTVKVAFRIDQNGELTMTKIIRSSGNKVMDENVLTAVRNAAPFVAPDDELKKKSVKEKFVVSFSPGKVWFE